MELSKSTYKTRSRDKRKKEKHQEGRNVETLEGEVAMESDSDASMITVSEGSRASTAGARSTGESIDVAASLFALGKGNPGPDGNEGRGAKGCEKERHETEVKLEKERREAELKKKIERREKEVKEAKEKAEKERKAEEMRLENVKKDEAKKAGMSGHGREV